jgi:hypothetical protein
MALPPRSVIEARIEEAYGRYRQVFRLSLQDARLGARIAPGQWVYTDDVERLKRNYFPVPVVDWLAFGRLANKMR